MRFIRISIIVALLMVAGLTALQTQAASCSLKLPFDIASNVPEAEIEIIKDGICLVQGQLNEFYDGDIPMEEHSTIPVKIVATGEGNQELGGGGACCTALDVNGARLFFDVLHPHWDQSTQYWTAKAHKMKTAAHEYTHAWQYSLGCLSISDQPLGRWMDEGIAEYVAYDTMIENNIINPGGVLNFMVSAAISTGQADLGLRELEASNAPVWPGHLGYIAVDWLIKEFSDETGQIVVREICTKVAEGTSFSSAFLDVWACTPRKVPV